MDEFEAVDEGSPWLADGAEAEEMLHREASEDVDDDLEREIRHG